MKKTFMLVATAAVLISLISSGSAASLQPGSVPSTADSSVALQQPASESNEIGSVGANPNANILIAYFSSPDSVNPDGVDAIAMASVVVKNGEVLGNTQYVANLIQQTVGGDLFRIETAQTYPGMRDRLLDIAKEEQQNNARPELTAHVENIADYDVIFLGYPNWWADMPMPLYTFLEGYDLSGKTIIPFCTHGGSGFSNTIKTIGELQPGATVEQNGLTISRNDVEGCKDGVIAWLQSLNYAE